MKFRTRDKLVNFRLTQQEYEALWSVAENSGATCISDYVRALVLPAIKGKIDQADEVNRAAIAGTAE